MLTWKLFYGDGSTFSDKDGDPHEAPPWGVQIIAQVEPQVGRRLWHGNDYYWFDDQWQGGDFVGLIDYLVRPGGYKVVRFGRSIRSAEFDALLNRAIDDPDLPPKTAWREDEPR